MKELKIIFSVLLFMVFLFCVSACSKNIDEVSDSSGASSTHNISSQRVESSELVFAEDSISDETLKDTEITVDFSTGNVISSSVSMDKTQSSSSDNGTSSVNVSSDTGLVEDDEGETSDEDVNTSSKTATVDTNKETMSNWTPWQ